MLRAARALSIALAVALLTGCAGLDLREYRTVLTSPAATGEKWRGLPVESGQIIVNESLDALSLFTSLAAGRYAPFIHAGIIVVEPGGPHVYESFGVYLPMPWTRPNQHMGGGVRRVTLEAFLLRGGIVEVHEPPDGVDRARLVEFARDSERRHVGFDGDFDPRDASRFYCVEFVARALEAGGATRIRAAPVTANPSMRVALDWFGVPGPELELAGDLVTRETRVALLSRSLSAAQVDAYFALKRELHRRFTADQKLGSLLAWKGQRLWIRPRIEAYLDEGVRTLEDPARLAERMFGGLPDTRLAGTRAGEK